MYVQVRVPRSSRAVFATFLLAMFGPSIAHAADDVPAAETGDQGRGSSAVRKDSDRLAVDSDDSKVDNFGAFSDTVPIEVPAFRKIAPKLSLTYQSSGRNGSVGVGWSLDGVGEIERASVGRGAPRYDATDIFLLDGEELVPCAGAGPSCTAGGTHATKTESFVKIALAGTGAASRWTVTAKDGTKSVYAPVFSVATDQVFRWALQQVSDTKGNVVNYNWGSNQLGGVGEYLDSITYNGTTIKFYYEARTDIETAAAGLAVSEKITARVKTIDVSVSGSRLRAYQFTYSTSAATTRSLLSSVRQFGKDATLDAAGTITGGTSLPPITAGYSPAVSPAFVGQTTDTAMGSGGERRFITLDINGDGKADMFEAATSCFIGCSYIGAAWISNGTGYTRTGQVTLPSYDETAQFIAMDVNGDGKDDVVSITAASGKWKRSVFLSNGTAFTAGTTDTSLVYKVDTKDDVKYVRSHFLPTDINGDGKTDMIEIFPKTDCFFLICSTSYGRAAWISNGSGFTSASNEVGMTYNTDSLFYAMDFNGDGKADFLEINPGSWGSSERRIWVGNGTSFTAVSAGQSGFDANMNVLPMDVNGDGKQDFVEFFPVFGGSRRKVWLSTGSSFVLGSDATNGMTVGASTRILPADVNGDGKVDFVAMTPAFLNVARQVYLSDGASFTGGTLDYLGNNSGHKYLAADVNGDGLTDMVELYTSWGNTGRKVWLTGGAYPDLLTSLGNGLGGTTTVAYTPSSTYANANNPFIVQTASSVTVSDGRGGSSVSTYAFSGGKYDFTQQRFLGFAYQKETDPLIAGETAAPYTETWYKQDHLGAVGLPTRIDERDGSGKLLRSQLFEYTTNTAAPFTAFPTGRWDYSYVGAGTACPGADCKRSYTTRTFNAYGEVTQEVDYGDYDVAGDEDITTIAYVPNTGAYIVNLPVDVKKFQGTTTAGTLLNEEVRYYDGATTWNAAPGAGFVTKVGRWLSSPSGFIESSLEYDAVGNLTATVDALGARTTYAYDATYKLFPTTVTNPLGHTSTSSYDYVCGAPTQTKNANAQATTITYDALCRVAQKSFPGGDFEKYTWVSLGNASAQYEQVERPAADGSAQAWWSRRFFDGQNRTWRDAAKGPNTTTGDIYVDSTYNPRGSLASKTAAYYWASGTPTVATTTFGYDALDRRTRVTFADGAQQTTSYGLWSTTTTDELGRAKTDRFNADGLRTAHVETVAGVAKTTSYAFDARGTLRTSTDPNGNTTTYTTDSFGRVTTRVDPDWGTSTYTYDGQHRLTASVDAKAQRTTFAYDTLGRRTSKTSKAGTAQASTVSWAYDQARTGYFNKGALTTVTDGAGTKTLDYDVAGRVVNTVRTINGASYAFQYGFDAGGRTLWTKYPDGDTQGTSASPLRYDSAGRVTSIPGFVTSVSYDASGEPTQIVDANGATTNRAVSTARGWVTAIQTTAGAATIQNLAYTRNAKGNVTQVTSPIANEGWSYAYDELDRVTTATNTSSSANNQALTYDAIGNIASNSRLGTYTYGATRPHAATAAGSGSYTYDASGLMLTGPNRTLTWNGDNRLASITNAGITTTFTYDADGERIQAQEGTIVRHYLGDDYEVANLGVATKYVSVAGQLVARKDGATTTWIHTDHLDSIQAETSAAGAEVYRKKYRPFGEVLSSSGSVDFEPRGYTGQRHDASGLVYLHARYYDPTLGRFISPDFIVDGSDTVGLNRYAYVGNNPTNATDPSGLAAVNNSRKSDSKCQAKKRNDPPPPPSYPQASEPASPPPAPPPPPRPAVKPTAKAAAPSSAPKQLRTNVVRPSPRAAAPSRSVSPSDNGPRASTGSRNNPPAQGAVNRVPDSSAGIRTLNSGMTSPGAVPLSGGVANFCYGLMVACSILHGTPGGQKVEDVVHIPAPIISVSGN